MCDARSPPRTAFRSMPRSAAVGTPSGSWRRPTLMAACSASMPTGRPSPGSTVASAPASATASSCARPTSGSSPTVAPEAGFGAVDGCLFDLGLSSFQLADAERGFGFRAGGPLDMRFDTGRGVPAAELLATLDADELTALFRRYGEEPKARRIARAIVDAPGTRPDRDRGGACRARRAGRAAEPAAAARIASRDPRLPGPADRGQRASSTRSRSRSRRRSTCCGRAAASSSSATTPSRTASSSASSPPSGAAASARRRCRSASAAGTRGCGSSPAVVTPTPDEIAANPRSRSARLRAAERLAA